MSDSKMLSLPVILLGASGAVLTLIGFLKKRRDASFRMCKASKSLVGKVVIVTGASSGLGLETVYELGKLGASVVMASRNAEKNKRAVENVISRVKNQPGSPKPILYPMHLDLSSLASVEEFAENFKQKFSQLDILVNNGGIMSCPFALSKDGIEMQFAVNHLGHFHLTNILLDTLRSTANSRIVIVSSGFYRKMKTADFTEVKTETPNYDSLSSYARSKLANCLQAFELGKVEEKVGAYAVQPGFVRGTDLGRNVPGILRVIGAPFAWFFSKSLNQGVQTILHCSIAPANELQSGSLYENCGKKEYVPSLVNETNAKQLWDLSLELIAEAKEKGNVKDTKKLV